MRPLLSSSTKTPASGNVTASVPSRASMPKGTLKSSLLRGSPTSSWRLKRLERYETEMIISGLRAVPDHIAFIVKATKALGGSPSEQVLTSDEFDRQVIFRLIPDGDVVLTITRYETS